jgi:drug/metabolite transporter (DMT)-like permease
MHAVLPDGRASNFLAILFVIGGALGFAFHDMLIKTLSGGYALHQITFFRGIISALVTLFVLMPLEGGWALRTPRWKLHLLRAFLVVIANMTFYASLATLPLGDATAIYFVAPLVITALSAIMLGEHVGPRRWAAVFIGLAGVLLVVQPGASAFQLASLLPVVSAMCYGLLQVLTRKVGLREKASTMSFYMQFAFIVFSAGVGLAFGDGAFAGSTDPSVEFLARAWIWPPVADWPILLGIGVIVSVSGYFIAQAYRTADAGLIAPFEYVAMPMAIMLGIVFFGTWPTPIAWAGITLIGGSGLYMFYRETVRSRESKAAS